MPRPIDGTWRGERGRCSHPHAREDRRRPRSTASAVRVAADRGVEIWIVDARRTLRRVAEARGLRRPVSWGLVSRPSFDIHVVGCVVRTRDLRWRDACASRVFSCARDEENGATETRDGDTAEILNNSHRTVQVQYTGRFSVL